MNRVTTRSEPPARTLSGRRFRRFFDARPEWGTFGLGAVAWAFVVPHALAHHGHVHHIMSFSTEFVNWCLMAVAMMVPLLARQVRLVALRSFRRRRVRSILLLIAGFLLPWIALGLPVAWFRTREASHNIYLPVVTFVLAALWTLTPLRKRPLMACHRTVPLAPSGWKADRDCLRYGLLLGGPCVATCGLLMAACTFTGHNLIAMIAGSLFGIWERRSFRPPVGRLAVATLLLAIWFLLPAAYQPLF